MVTTTCDICKKKVDDPVTGRSFFYFTTHGICEPCKDNLDFHIRTTIRGKEPYAIEWYDKFVDDSIVKAIQKGKG